MSMVRLLDSFPLIETCDLDQMRASLARIYVEPVIELVGRNRALHVVINHCQLRHIGLNYASYGADVHFQYPESNYVGQVFPIGGSAVVVVDGTPVAIDPNRSVLFSADSTFTMTSTAAYERLFLTFEPTALTEKLAAITGDPIHSPLKLGPAQDLTQPLAQILRKNLGFLVDRLSATDSVPSPIVAEFEQVLMVMFLHANRHNYSHLLELDPPDVAPRQVRRAEEYIEANAMSPLSLEGLAAATEVSIRSLFKGFKRSHDYSPAEFLKQLRLCRAHELLQHPGPGATVMDIALACGFSDLDRFAKDYQMEFGERPSATLDRSRGAGPTRH